MELPLKKWYNIHPTLIGSDFVRYEVISLKDNVLTAYAKRPRSDMEFCDSCPGPHSKRNKTCSQNISRTPYIPAPAQGGIFLFELYTKKNLPGIWVLDQENKPVSRKSAVVVLSR